MDTNADATSEKGGDTLPPAPETENSDSRAAEESTKEVGGRSGPEPTRFGDWEKNGRCIDF